MAMQPQALRVVPTPRQAGGGGLSHRGTGLGAGRGAGLGNSRRLLSSLQPRPHSSPGWAGDRLSVAQCIPGGNTAYEPAREPRRPCPSQLPGAGATRPCCQDSGGPLLASRWAHGLTSSKPSGWGRSTLQMKSGLTRVAMGRVKQPLRRPVPPSARWFLVTATRQEDTTPFTQGSGEAMPLTSGCTASPGWSTEAAGLTGAPSRRLPHHSWQVLRGGPGETRWGPDCFPEGDRLPAALASPCVYTPSEEPQDTCL